MSHHEPPRAITGNKLSTRFRRAKWDDAHVTTKSSNSMSAVVYGICVLVACICGRPYTVHSILSFFASRFAKICCSNTIGRRHGQVYTAILRHCRRHRPSFHVQCARCTMHTVSPYCIVWQTNLGMCIKPKHPTIYLMFSRCCFNSVLFRPTIILFTYIIFFSLSFWAKSANSSVRFVHYSLHYKWTWSWHIPYNVRVFVRLLLLLICFFPLRHLYTSSRSFLLAVSIFFALSALVSWLVRVFAAAVC